jgi:hypothetical protein
MNETQTPKTMTLNIYLTKDLGLEGGKYTVMCEETSANVQFNNKRELTQSIKTGDIYRLDWGC